MRHGPFLHHSVLENGRTRKIHLPKGWGEKVLEGIAAAQQYRHARQKWFKLEKEMQGLWKEVERCRQSLPYEPKKRSR